MDGFQLTVVAMAFSDSQWQDDWTAIRLAERRRAEFLGEAEYERRIREAEAAVGKRGRSITAIRNRLLARLARIGMKWRLEETMAPDLAPGVADAV